jgi:hypothetical protein
MIKKIVSIIVLLMAAAPCPAPAATYESTYELIRWGNRNTDSYYCINILDENWEPSPDHTPIACGEGLHFWSPKSYVINDLKAPDLAPGVGFTWKVWSPSGYGGEGFEGKVVVGTGTRPLELYAVSKNNTGTGNTEVFLVNSGEWFQTLLQMGTILPMTGPDNSWAFEMGDFNHDGIPDLYAIRKSGSESDATEVHILNGADKFRTYLLNAVTPLGQTGTDNSYRFKLGDYNDDGKDDIYVFALTGNESGTTELFILNGADLFQSFMVATPTILPETLDFNRWEFEVGDYTNDGRDDVVVISRSGNVTGQAEVHVMNPMDNFQTLLQISTAFRETPNDRSVVFETADFNRDGYLDIYVVQRSGTGSGTTELHVLSGADKFKSYLLHTTTILGETGNDSSWEFFIR